MSERSEFGLRAASGEARRGPMRLHRIGECPAMAVLLTFDKTKVSRANSAEALFFAVRRGHARQANEASAQLSPAARASSFLRDQKGTKKSLRRTRSAAIQPRRSPALLGRQGTQPKLAALRHGLLFGPAALRCSARFTARRSKANSNSNSNGNGNGNGKSEGECQWLRHTPPPISPSARPPQTARTAAAPRAPRAPRARRPPARPGRGPRDTAPPNARGCSRACAWC